MARRMIQGIGSEFLAHHGLAQRPEIWEDGLRTGGKRGLFEWWRFEAILENDTTLTIVFFTRHPVQRHGPLTPSVKVAIKRSGFPIRRWGGPFPANSFGGAGDRCDVSIGDNWVRGDLHSYTLHVDLDEVAVDLELTSQAEPWRLGSGMTFYDEAMRTFFAWIVPVLIGEVKGRIRLDGKEHSFQGAGYHDHNWGNVDLHRVFSHWYWGRFHLPPYTGIFVEMTGRPGYGRQRIPILMLAREGRVIFEMGTGHVWVEADDFRSHSSGHRYPTRLAWHAADGERRLHITLQDAELIEEQSLLEMVSAQKRVLGRLLGMNPYYFRFRSPMTLDIHLPEAQETLSGTALYEIMHLS